MQVSDIQVCEALVRRCGLTEEQRGEIVLGRQPGLVEEERAEMVTFSATGLTCFFHAESSLGRSIIEDAFGFRPTKNLTFRIDKFDDYDEGIINMLCVCSAVIKELSGDCVLLENGDTPLLLRRGGRMLLQSRDPFWISKLEMIAVEVGEPYSFDVIPVL
jgi:hypothetical protein